LRVARFLRAIMRGCPTVPDRLIAKRMALLDSSGIRKIFDLAANMADPVNFSIGQPDFDVPEAAKEAAIEAIRNGENRYTVTQGIPQLHERLRRLLREQKRWEPEGLLITSGASGALILALLVLVEKGDEVLIGDPYFVMYKHLVNLAGGTPRLLDTYDDFELTAPKVEKAITRRTKVLILNSPCNPTGAVISAQELERIAAVARRHNLVVISDEIYSDFSYEESCPSMAGLYDKVLLVHGFSKTYAMTGWRMGYAAGPAEIIAEMTKLQQFSFVCAPSMAQWGALKALEIDPSAYVDAFKRKRDRIYDGLKGAFDVRRPSGAFYIFPKAPWASATEFVEEAIRNNVLMIPGKVFSERDTHFRISYATSLEQIDRGVEILNRLARSRS